MNQILALYTYIHNNENGFVRFVDEVFDAEIYSRASPKLNIIDLGAFQGEYSFSCLPFAKHIWAIEPDPTPYAKMAEMVEKFDLKDKMSIYPIAIYDQTGKKLLHASGGGGSAIADKPDDKTVEVDTLSLNEFMIREKIESVDILKIDVESSEYEIFGAGDFKDAVGKIKMIIGEPHADQDRIRNLEKYGFKVEFWPEHTFTATR